MLRDPLGVGALAALALGAACLAGAATWRAVGRGLAPTATAIGLGAWCGAAACVIWRRKRAGDDAAAADLSRLSLARGDWEPSPGTALTARREQRPVALAPLEAALVCGIAPAHAVAALLAEFARSGLVAYAPGDPATLTVGRVEPDDPYGRLLGRAAGEAIGAATATALATHAAAEAGRKIAAGGRAASAAYYAACWAAAAETDGPVELAVADPLGRPAASRGLAKDLASALDPAIPPSTPWVKSVAARLAPELPPIHIELPAPVWIPADAGLHTAAAGGAVVGELAEATG